MNLKDEAQLLRAKAAQFRQLSQLETDRSSKQYWLGAQYGAIECAKYLELSHQLHQLGNMQREEQ